MTARATNDLVATLDPGAKFTTEELQPLLDRAMLFLAAVMLPHVGSATKPTAQSLIMSAGCELANAYGESIEMWASACKYVADNMAGDLADMIRCLKTERATIAG
jgi:hypothetical protein